MLTKDEILKMCIEALQLEEDWRNADGLTSDKIRLQAGIKRTQALKAYELLTEPETHEKGRY